MWTPTVLLWAMTQNRLSTGKLLVFPARHRLSEGVAMIKATMSQDLEFRVNLRVEHRLTKDELVTALAHHATTYGDDLENVSEKDALTFIRATLREEGEDTIAFLNVDELDPVVVAYAEEAIDRIWGEQR